MSWLRHTLESARQSLVLQARSKMVFLLLLVLAAFAALFVFGLPRAASRENRGDVFFGLTAYLAIVQFALPFTLMYLGIQAMHTDLEDRTASYLFVRPVRRSSILLGRWLATWLLGAALVALALLTFHLSLSLPGHAWRQGMRPDPAMLGLYCAAASLGAGAYAATGCLFGVWLRRPLVAGVTFLVGWELIVSNLPPQAGLRGATVADPVRRWILAELPADLPHDPLKEMLTGALERVDMTKLTDPVWAILRFGLVVLVLALWIYSRREYDSRPRD